jgi:hypothetical protein
MYRVLLHNEWNVLLQVMDGFMIIVSCTGNILFVTHTVETLLGHPQVRHSEGRTVDDWNAIRE